MANHCNDFFINVGINMAKKIPHTDKIISNFVSKSSMFLSPVIRTELINHINLLKNDSAPGLDGITAKSIKLIHPHILQPLLHIINLIFQTGIVPKQFKTTIVCPIHKNGKKDDINNYRPISLINNFGKIFEKCLKARLLQFLKDNNILSQNQYGFVGEVSTTDAMYELVKQVTESLNLGKRSVAVFLDLAKAFDTVSHEEMLNVLEMYGVRGVVRELFKSYLSERIQVVKIRDTYSDSKNIKIGVPQGTVIGPILFISYINSLLTLDINGTIISYADDTVLLFSGNCWDEVREKVKLGLHKVKRWLDSNKLTLNLSKTNYIAFSITSSNRPDFTDIAVDTFQDTIKEVSNTKYLGIIIDKYLRWDCHVLRLKNNIRKLMHRFYLLREILSKKLLISIYKALVESLIRYGIVVWGGLSDSSLRQLNVIQNTILKIIYKKEKRYRTELLYDSIVFNTRSLYVLNSCVYVYKNEKMKKYIGHMHNTRSKIKQNLQIPISYKKVNQKFIGYLGPKMYNMLPIEIRNTSKVIQFVQKCKAYIFEKNTDFLKLFK